MQPGPIVPLDPAHYDLVVDPPEFGDGAAADLAALDPEDQVQVDALNTATGLAATPVDQLLGTGLDDAAAALDYEDAQTAAEPPDTSQDELDVIAATITDAYVEIPGEAWEEQPLPFSTGSFIPSAPTEPPPTPQIPPLPPGVPQPQTPEWPPPPWVYLTNMTHPGQPFIKGDLWQITVKGNIHRIVSMSGTQNGVAFAPVDLGTTRDDGYFLLQGHMMRTELGTWTEEWFVAGQKCWPGTITFTVTES